jgi:hypothetical protein
LVSGRTVVRLFVKLVGAALLAATAYLAYQFATTPFTALPLIGAVTGFFIFLAVAGSLLILLS